MSHPSKSSRIFQYRHNNCYPSTPVPVWSKLQTPHSAIKTKPSAGLRTRILSYGGTYTLKQACWFNTQSNTCGVTPLFPHVAFHHMCCMCVMSTRVVGLHVLHMWYMNTWCGFTCVTSSHVLSKVPRLFRPTCMHLIRFIQYIVSIDTNSVGPAQSRYTDNWLANQTASFKLIARN